MEHAKGSRRVLRYLPALLLMAAAISAQAQIYKWSDESGQIHYSQSPPPNGDGLQVEKISVDSRTPSPSTLPPVNEEGVRHCGSLALPANRPDPVTNIAMFKQAIEVWQKFIDENLDKSDKAALKAIEERRCAIAYARQQLQALSGVEQDIEANYQRVSDELEELQQQVAECDEQAAEDEAFSAAQCKQQYQPRIEQLETMLHRLEGPRKAIQPAQ
jgi:hypothetical protein